MFLCMQAVNQGNTSVSSFLSFEDVKDAEQHIKTWIEQSCGLEFGDDPSTEFQCPEVMKPEDLMQYNGYYHYDGLGSFELFLFSVHDEKSAKHFARDVIKEYELDKTFDDEADEMIEFLRQIEQSFIEQTDFTEARKRINDFIQNGGLRLF